MTRGRQRPLARNKAWRKFKKHHKYDGQSIKLGIKEIFDIAFNMGWKSHRGKNEKILR